MDINVLKAYYINVWRYICVKVIFWGWMVMFFWMFLLSRLMQPRGLKYTAWHTDLSSLGRGLCSLVDWNSIGLMIISGRLRRGLCSLVDWNLFRCSGFRCAASVEAYAASWIEIHKSVRCYLPLSVEAYAASWIEMVQSCIELFEREVEAYAASWIEIIVCRSFTPKLESRLMQPRGLKSETLSTFVKGMCRGLCSLVDWNTLGESVVNSGVRRGLCSLVDWNHKITVFPHIQHVEAYAASWIEILSSLFS